MWRVGPVRQGAVNHVRRVNRAALSGQSCAPQSACRHMIKEKLYFISAFVLRLKSAREKRCENGKLQSSVQKMET